MRFWTILASVAAHAAVISAVWMARQPVSVVDPLPSEEPLQFVLVEESCVSADKAPLPEKECEEEKTETDPIPAMPEPAPAETRQFEKDDPPLAANAIDESSVPAVEERAKVVSAPQALNRIVPRYPRSARSRRREGWVTVEFVVTPQGKVDRAEVVSSSGYRDLDAAALDSVRKAVFSPACEDDVPVASTLRLSFEFRLRN